MPATAVAANLIAVFYSRWRQQSALRHKSLDRIVNLERDLRAARIEI